MAILAASVGRFCYLFELLMQLSPALPNVVGKWCAAEAFDGETVGIWTSFQTH